MSTNTLSRHPALVALGGRVRARRVLRNARRGTLVGLGGATLTIVTGRLVGLDAWPQAALGVCALGVVVGLGAGLLRGPDDWAVAREADALGLAERITSALHANASQARVASLVDDDARAALASLDPSRYPISEGARAWRSLGVAALILAILVVAPLPRMGQSADPQDPARVTAAQQRVEAMQLAVPTGETRPSDLNRRTSQELQALRDALARSTTSAEAAQALEQAQQQLSRLPNRDDYNARRALDSVAAALEAQHDDTLIPLARALRSHDEQAVQQALADLSSQLNRSGSDADAERANAQVALQSAANAAAGSQPQLAGALRKAASAVGSNQAGALSDKEVQELLSQDATDAAALGNLEQTSADLSQLRATILPAGATLVAATGTPTAYALVRGTPPPNATPVGVSAQPGAGPAGSGQDGGNGSGQGGGSGASPNGTQPYDPVYAPTHLGGDPGEQVAIGGDATGATGAGVDVPQGPVTTGDVRPYDQVYAQYADEARQSAARQSLPPNVQGLVDRYFGAIAPTPGAAPP